VTVKGDQKMERGQEVIFTHDGSGGGGGGD
jgi:hypothetical protein